MATIHNYLKRHLTRSSSAPQVPPLSIPKNPGHDTVSPHRPKTPKERVEGTNSKFSVLDSISHVFSLFRNDQTHFCKVERVYRSLRVA